MPLRPFVVLPAFVSDVLHAGVHAVSALPFSQPVLLSAASVLGATALVLTLLRKRLGWTYLAHRTDKGAQTALVALYMGVGGDKAMT